MLATEERKLHWMGIDMRPRWRRRAAVVATYFVIVVLNGAILSWAGGSALLARHPLRELLAIVLVSTLWLYFGVFRPGGVIKSFEDTPFRFKKGPWFLGSIDEFARFRFGVASFDEANEEQKQEILRKMALLRRPVANGGSGGVRFGAIDQAGLNLADLDERELAERDRHSRWALRQMAFLLALLAASAANHRVPISPLDTSVLLWSFSLLAMTLPQAHVLWTEPDPRAEEESSAQTEAGAGPA